MPTGPSMNPAPEPWRELAALCARAQASGWRGLALVQGMGEEAWPGLAAVLGAALWAGSAAPEGFEALDENRSRTGLGGACRHAVLDLRAAARPDLLGRLGGMLRAGGVLVLLLPPPEAPLSRFLERLLRLAEGEDWILRLPPQGASGGVLPERPTTRDTAQARADQVAVVEALCLAAEAAEPAVLLAPRGRGKSAALGMAARRLLESGRAKRVMVSAPSRRALDSFFAFFGSGAGDGLVFLPPDALPAALDEDTWLILDEAAALGSERLRRLIAATPRLWMATTTEGYEGSGRGFVLRQLGWLRKHHPRHRVLRLTRPMRWSSGDPLEAWLQRVLCLNPALPTLPAATAEGVAPIEHLCLDRARLVRDEALLAEVFGLLVSAHYRTRPSDLALLLDGEDVTVHALREQGRIVALALVQHEAGLAPELAQAVYAGQRRPPGRLQAQSLAAHVGLPEAATLDQRRILRIAVRPERQRQGLGRRLLQAVAGQTRAEGGALLGASFAAEPGLLDFWQACGFLPVHLGLRPERSTGLPSLLVLQGLDARGEAVVAEARALMGRRLGCLQEHGLLDLPPGLPLPEGPVAASRLAAERAACLHGLRGFELALHALLPEVRARMPLPEPLATLWRLRVEQGLDWPRVARAAGLSGKRAAREAMRAGLRDLLSGA